ncbi:PilZ domain-containing protein [Halobacillus litoralis]|uniref:PilZ domain-containing protein n=1 Tax=Halobacillus litoralis TaxID=45668 RepID=UPI001CD4AC65|nr:PilZ domain-containing protein [Halobacillus litoralis]MCA0971890.1 PilZ domain-containing protein [Halobacillus litoralis]
MMRYRRHETLRYQFTEPVEAKYRIVKLGGRSIQSSFGKAHILDLSPGGMRLATSFNIPLDKPVQFFIQTTLAGVELGVTANVIWCKRTNGEYWYGLDFLEDYDQDVVNALKSFRKSQSS